MATMEELLSGTHEHEVLDTDSRFFVDATTRSISSGYPTKTRLIQGDHNSERFEFEIPRWIEEHDMSLCDKVEVHYININTEAGARDEKSVAGLYEVHDVRVDPDDENLVICSWLIDYHATQFVGPLNFLLCFKCEKDGVISYAWHTAPYVGISIISAINADETFEADYCDVIERWKESVMSELHAKLQATVDSATADIAAWKEKASGDVSSEMAGLAESLTDLTDSKLTDSERRVNESLAEWGETLDVERVRINELVAMRSEEGVYKQDFTHHAIDEIYGTVRSNGIDASIVLRITTKELTNAGDDNGLITLEGIIGSEFAPLADTKLTAASGKAVVTLHQLGEGEMFPRVSIYPTEDGWENIGTYRAVYPLEKP